MKTLACVTMTFNEPDWLPVWLSYYGSQVGLSNCYVVDHGSTDGSTEDLKGAHKVWLPRSPIDERKRASFVSNFCAALLEYYDFVLYSDVDEMVVADPAHYKGLLEYVAEAPPKSVTTCLGMNVLHKMHSEVALRPELMIRQEKRRNQWFPDEKTNQHHRLDDRTIAEHMINWSTKLETIDDITLDQDCLHTNGFMSKILASESKDTLNTYSFDINIKNNCLWKIPERFKMIF